MLLLPEDKCFKLLVTPFLTPMQGGTTNRAFLMHSKKLSLFEVPFDKLYVLGALCVMQEAGKVELVLRIDCPNPFEHDVVFAMALALALLISQEMHCRRLPLIMSMAERPWNMPLKLLQNFMGSKMGRGFHNTCNDDHSTSTINQQQPSHGRPSSSSCIENDHNTLNVPPRKSVTLEEMILQLELEEAKARKEKATTNKIYNEEMDFPRRMSCVNNSDILRSARNALDQYPRFSLDGRDAMYRSSFRKNNMASRAIDGLKLGRMLRLPHSVGGESVIWCKPGVVPKLMGLEAMPLPISKLCNNKISSSRDSMEKLSNTVRNHNLKRREKNELERRQHMRQAMNSNIRCGDVKRFGRGGGGYGGGHCSSSTGYCVMKPVAVEPVYGLGRPISRPSSYNLAN